MHVKSAFRATLLISIALVLSASSLVFAGDRDGGCGTDPNPSYSIKTQIASCTTMTHEGMTQFIGGGLGFVHSGPPETRAWAYYQRGLLYQFSGQLDLAVSDYTKAIGWRRTFGDAYAARGDVYEMMGDQARAAADYAEAAALNSDDATGLNGRCWARAIRGYPLDRALADCNAALAEGRPVGREHILDSRCFVHFRMTDYKAAIEDCNAALAIEARLANSLYIRGLSELKLGETDAGNADVAAAKDSDYRIEETYALYGVKP